MHFHEEIVLRMAKERIEDAVRVAEETRATRCARERRSARFRLGGALVRLGHWMLGQPSPAASTPGRRLR